MLVKSLFLCPSNRWRSSDLENKIPRSSDVYMVPKKVSVVKQRERERIHFNTLTTARHMFTLLMSKVKASQ